MVDQTRSDGFERYPPPLSADLMLIANMHIRFVLGWKLNYITGGERYCETMLVLTTKDPGR